MALAQVVCVSYDKIHLVCDCGLKNDPELLSLAKTSLQY